jgi:hypothetical protein
MLLTEWQNPLCHAATPKCTHCVTLVAAWRMCEQEASNRSGKSNTVSEEDNKPNTQQHVRFDQQHVRFTH